MARPKAPRCCDTPMTPIAYGLPGSELFEAAERGEVELGGCVIDDSMPLYVCRRCGRTEGRLGDDDGHFERDVWT